MPSIKMSMKARSYGFAAGIAIFVTIALYALIAANKPTLVRQQVPGAVPTSAISMAEQLGHTYAKVAAHVKPAVVSVYSEKMIKMQEFQLPFPFSSEDNLFEQLFEHTLPNQSEQPRQYSIPQHGMGSGMILDQQGHILTNYHVVGDVDEIKVQLDDKRSFDAKIIGSDPMTDVAVIKIIGTTPPDLPVVQLGDSDQMEDGYLVMAIGAPFGLTQTVTHGIISAKGRSDVGVATYEDLLQTDAPINPGNSGGPLVNMRGEVIGMNSAIATGGMQFDSEGQSAGVGFAIPSNMIKTLLPTLIKGGHIIRGMIGVVIQDLNEDLAKHFKVSSNKGALVSQVTKNSPAEKAGIKSGDIIVKFGDAEISDTRQLRNLVASTPPGRNVNVKVMRNGTERLIKITIAKATTDTPETSESGQNKSNVMNRLSSIGLKVQTLTPELAMQFKMQEENGVLVVGIDEGSPASAANMQVGDLILEANLKPVSHVEDLQEILSEADKQVLLLIKRQGSPLFVIIKLK